MGERESLSSGRDGWILSIAELLSSCSYEEQICKLLCMICPHRKPLIFWPILHCHMQSQVCLDAYHTACNQAQL